MKTRIKIDQLEPEAYQAMMVMEKYLAQSTIEPVLVSLIKIRASQLNGCAYCIEMHANEALKQGESQNKLFALSAWRESPLFSEKEKAAFTITEEITHISNGGVSDKTFEFVKCFFTANEIASLIMLIGTINTWNRIAVSTQMFHEE